MRASWGILDCRRSALVTCVLCGTREPELPPAWTMSVEGSGDRRRTSYFCESCSRENLRSIEAGLEQEWW